jgi:hypothetical protein
MQKNSGALEFKSKTLKFMANGARERVCSLQNCRHVILVSEITNAALVFQHIRRCPSDHESTFCFGICCVRKQKQIVYASRISFVKKRSASNASEILTKRTLNEDVQLSNMEMIDLRKQNTQAWLILLASMPCTVKTHRKRRVATKTAARNKRVATI